jgi:NADPH-dependent 2,4-dienoyl-CoA reductase/sulfur reductase-like enzyme
MATQRTVKTRRQILHGAATAAAATTLWPRALRAQAVPRVVIVGGGFAGAACARALRAADDKLAITLVEARSTYTAPPLSNGVLGGIRELKQQQFGYDKIAATGIKVAIASATAIDAEKRSVTLSTGDTLPYDRLVLAPGIDLRFDGIKGYSEAAAEQVPHAWTADAKQFELLRAQITAMADGGTVAIVAPDNPSRCPPGPYERASMIAHYLKANKPKAKIVILDAKDTFTMQQLFLKAWQELYPGMIEWKSLSNGGNVASIDIAKKSIETDFDTYEYAVANVIPPQQAGKIATLADVVDRSGWCPVDPVTFESVKHKNIHIVGDAAFAGSMPKSAFSGLIEGKLAAAAIVRLLKGETPAAAQLASNCYSVVAPGYAISITGAFAPANGEFTEVDNSIHSSPLDAPPSLRADDAKKADAWFSSATSEIFG